MSHIANLAIFSSRKLNLNRPRCRHLAKWTKRTRRLWFWSLLSIMCKHDIIHKTGTT